MTGIYQHTLDAKGRLFIPAKLREELGDTFYVTVSPEKCQSAYSQENWKAISEKAAAMTNLCRCGTYNKIADAVRLAAG